MWQIKKFKTYMAQQHWIGQNAGQYQIVPLFVANGYAVEFKPLFCIGCGE